MNFKIFVKKIAEIFPLKDIIIFESNPDFTDNTYWFFKYLVEEVKIQNKYKLIWFVKSEKTKKKTCCGVKIESVNINSSSLFEKFKRIYYQLFAKIIIDCNLFVPKFSRRQFRVFLGHGMPIKSIDTYLKGNTDANLITITSNYFESYYKRCSAKDSNIQVLGNPRNDILIFSTHQHKSRDGCHRIAWLPTYRQHVTVEENRVDNIFPFGLPLIKKQEDFQELNEFLKQNKAVIYFRPHPAQDLSCLALQAYSNFVIADDVFLEENNLQLYELIAQTDALITDYSSVYFDYLLTEKPIGLCLEDLDIYTQRWPIVLKDIDKELVGSRLVNLQDLKDFVIKSRDGKNEFLDKANDMKIRFHTIVTPDSSERIYRYMLEKGVFK